ncbi:HEAT repeat domain-containing protein [Streptomyces sp. DK15]|uniref:HEAT repeat domain-containing protein n=1 Tax=Streptomyces sp. DK15 TaxID=2957499 RepID=UPI0029BC94EF|nr:HEAT repeat domain-containing protein [Streptomyces sp. DK15]MDX2393686.1 HEAT repeat domain-containing protein [Streptomyces sp. DK15]
MSQEPTTTPDPVPWAELDHFRGSAENIPEVLSACTDPARSKRALAELWDCLQHQGGTLVSAAPPVLPVLLDWAHDPTSGLRLPALGLIGKLARDGRTSQPSFVAAAWFPAWERATPRLLELLADPDPEVRRLVPFPLAQAVAGAAEVLPALHARWKAEPDTSAAVGLVFAAGQLLRHTPARWPPEVIDWLTALPAHPDPDQRFAGVLALRRSGLGGRDPRHLDEAAAYIGAARTAAWQRSWAGPGRPEWLPTRIDGLLGDDREGRTRLAATLLERGDGNALPVADAVMSRWRSPVRTLLPLVAARLSDPAPPHRRRAVALLAAAGRRAEPWADELVAACADEERHVAPSALHALVRIGDPRAVPLAAERLRRPFHGLRPATCHGGTHMPSLGDVLNPLRPFAADLLPALRDRLRTAPTSDERRGLLGVLTDWGASAAPATGDLVALLGTDAEPWALDALVAIGTPEARSAALPVVEASLGGPDGRAPERHWRLTGDPTALLAPGAARPRPELLAELGPAAASLAAVIRSEPKPAWPGWGSVWSRYALWRITADPADAREAVAVAGRTLREERVIGAHGIRALEHLAALGPLARPLVPVLHPVLTADVRPVGPGQWGSVPEDDALCEAARTLLTAAGG